MKGRILIVEDEQHLADGLRFNLEAEGYEVDTVDNGLDAVARPACDLVLLDVMLPGMNGFDVATALRARGDMVPILMLTARSRPEDVLKGFEAGADDYLPKPFDLSILMARVMGLLRRAKWQRPSADVFEFAGKRIDFDRLELSAKGERIPLTQMEASLLRYLVRHEGRAVGRKEILESVWDVHEDTDTRAIDNFIVRLRKYVEADAARPRHLLTVRGIGYRFVANPDSGIQRAAE
ncbi:MAG: response regulator transcription factor [Bryobacteraceae bacterium]|nr:response regulator transcription factor [Bryobacteraceae bacterium]